MPTTTTSRSDTRQYLASVLVVEDDDTIRELLVSLLTREGYFVAQAANGQEALDFLLATDTRQIVLLDWDLPELTGTELLTKLSLKPSVGTRHTYLLLTAWYDWLGTSPVPAIPPLRIAAMSKPFDIDELLAWLADAAGALNVLSTPQDQSETPGSLGQ